MTTANQATLADAHRHLLADGAIQFDLPTFVQPKPSGWVNSVIDFFTWLSPAFPYIFWGAIALVGALIVYWLVQNRGSFGGWRRRVRTTSTHDDWRVDATVARALLAEAEALAAQGRYAEAARLLLQRSVEDIGTRLPEFLKPSLTARDIARAPALPENARPAFAAIARVVEVSAFGARAVTVEAWDQCRAAYARLVTPDAWAGSRQPA